jgi:uncharacterized protein YceK
MKKMMNLALAVVMLGAVASGCGTVMKDTKVKCPKCGHIFTVDEGRRALEAP